METLTLELKFAAGERGLVSGYASLFGRPADYVHDVIEPGAFTASLRAHRTAGTLPAMLREHKGEPVGRWLAIEEDALGLRVTGRFDTDNEAGQTAYQDAIGGQVDGLSIGYRAVKAERGPDGFRTLHEIDLHEISFVRRPASSRARVLSVKSAPVDAIAAKGAALSKDKPMTDKTTAPGGEAGSDEADVSARVDGLASTVSAIDTRLSAVEDKVGAVKSVADRIETRLNRPGAPIETKAQPEKLESKAFNLYLRRGDSGLGEIERKALTVGVDASAGFLAPETFGTEILRALVEHSPIRAFAKVVTVAGPEIKYPRRLTGTNAAWVTEIETRPESSLTYGQVTITPGELATFVEISKQLLEDASYNVEAELRDALAEDFGVKEGAAFIAGDGVNKPKGLLASGTGIAEMVSGAASTLGSAPGDTLINLFSALPSAHAQKGAWLMNRSTLATIRKVKDSQGAYIWQPGLQAGQPSTLLGRPVIEAVDMPSVGAGAYPVVFGDFSGYRIVDRVGLSVLVDPFTRAKNGITVFHARMRVGGDVTHPDRFVKLKVAAS